MGLLHNFPLIATLFQSLGKGACFSLAIVPLRNMSN